MRSFVFTFLILICAVLPASAQERVTLPVSDGKPLMGMIFRPNGPGPFPAVIAMHGCGGLTTGSGNLGARHMDWGRTLSEKGFIVLMPDSYGSRGLASQCLVKDRTVRPNRERVEDALIAKTWLQARSDVISNRVSLLGWSNGGSSVLWSIAADKKVADYAPDFYRAISFYPGCRLILEAAQRGRWQNRTPLLVLIGEADTWTPAEHCRQLVSNSNAAKGQASIIIYPRALHDFDHPDRTVTRRTGLAFTGDNTGEALVGTDRAAREDALLQVPAFLK